MLKYYIVGHIDNGVSAPVKDENGVMGWKSKDKADAAADTMNKELHRPDIHYTVEEFIRH